MGLDENLKSCQFESFLYSCHLSAWQISIMITKMIYHSCESVCQHFDLKSDKHLISPHNTTPGLNIKITRIKEMITSQRISWLLNKFSLSAP